MPWGLGDCLDSQYYGDLSHKLLEGRSEFAEEMSLVD